MWLFVHLHTIALQPLTARWLGIAATSVCSSIWYYLALIELSALSSFSPPSALPLSSFLLLPARITKREGRDISFFFVCCCQLTSFENPFIKLFFSPLNSFIYFTLHLFLLSVSSCNFFLSAAPLSSSFSCAIVNFNLRAGLNGTIRECSMLLIWMPAHLDLTIQHRSTEGWKKITLFIIRQTHQPTLSNNVDPNT